MNWKIRPVRATSATLFLGPLLVLVTASIAPALLLNGNSEAYAKDYSQSSSQTEICGNGSLPSNVYCSNQESEVQGDDNVISNTAGQSSQARTSPYDSIDLNKDSSSTPTRASDGNTNNGLNTNENINEEDSSSVGTLTDEDPALLVLPCCDEMPGDSTNSA
jgi:hypothetical protein